MFRFVGLVARKAVGLVTRRILRDALASAIVTIVVTAAFTGFATRREPPVPVPAQVARAATPQAQPRTKMETAAAAPAEDAMKVWLDPNAVAPNPKGFQRPAATGAAHPAPRKRGIAVRSTPAAPPRVAAQAPRASSPSLASSRADDKALGHRRASDALALAVSAPEKRGFRVWGVAPGDLIPSVPSASSIVRGVKSVGSSVVSWMPSL